MSWELVTHETILSRKTSLHKFCGRKHYSQPNKIKYQIDVINQAKKNLDLINNVKAFFSRVYNARISLTLTY